MERGGDYLNSPFRVSEIEESVRRCELRFRFLSGGEAIQREKLERARDEVRALLQTPEDPCERVRLNTIGLLYDTWMNTAFQDLLVDLSKNTVQKPSTPAEPPKNVRSILLSDSVKKALLVMRINPHLSAPEVAQAVGKSPSRLEHLFKTETGRSLRRIRNRMRMRYAAELMQSSEVSLKEVAGTVGYQHQSSFSRAFKREYSCPPEEFRRRRAKG